MNEASRYPKPFPPRFASAWGDDRFGLWAEVTVESEGGEPVVQRMRWIEPGTFWMGSPEEETKGLARSRHERGWFEREHPRHAVALTQGYWLANTPCTQALWRAVTGQNPSRFQSPDRPVERVKWNDVQNFLRKLETLLPDCRADLPTEAEWEYACRAGTETALYTGPIEILGANNAPALDSIAWYSGNSGVGFELDDGADSSDWPEKQFPHARAGTRPVAQKKPNDWGLYDMLGNVWEWCSDGRREYDGTPQIDPLGPVSNDKNPHRAVRGGSWGDYAGWARSAYRSAYLPGYARSFLGFRLCLRSIEPGPV